MNMRLMAPNGCEIIGTLERVYGVAGINTPRANADGGFEFEWDGGTKIEWDSQETVRRSSIVRGPVTKHVVVKRPKNERIFICANDEEWFESELKLEAVEENADA